MATGEQCPECSAVWANDPTCETYFHQLLFWEVEDAHLFVVHHLTVLCYHIQHPHLYSPDGLTFSMGLLTDFVQNGLTTEGARSANRAVLDSGNRNIKITGTAEAFGAFAHPVKWSMTAADVVSNGKERYIESVQAWARTVLGSLSASG